MKKFLVTLLIFYSNLSLSQPQGNFEQIFNCLPCLVGQDIDHPAVQNFIKRFNLHSDSLGRFTSNGVLNDTLVIKNGKVKLIGLPLSFSHITIGDKLLGVQYEHIKKNNKKVFSKKNPPVEEYINKESSQEYWIRYTDTYFNTKIKMNLMFEIGHYDSFQKHSTPDRFYLEGTEKVVNNPTCDRYLNSYDWQTSKTLDFVQKEIDQGWQIHSDNIARATTTRGDFYVYHGPRISLDSSYSYNFIIISEPMRESIGDYTELNFYLEKFSYTNNNSEIKTPPEIVDSLEVQRFKVNITESDGYCIFKCGGSKNRHITSSENYEMANAWVYRLIVLKKKGRSENAKNEHSFVRKLKDGEKNVETYRWPKITESQKKKYITGFCESGSCTNGYGVYKDGSGTYKGNFINGKFHGDGEIIYDDGSQFQGKFKDGKLHGNGKLQHPDYELTGDYYGGYIMSGTVYWKNGNVYKGEFKYGIYHGKGDLTFADGTRENGTFQNGKLYNGNVYDSSGNLITSITNGADNRISGYTNTISTTNNVNFDFEKHAEDSHNQVLKAFGSYKEKTGYNGSDYIIKSRW